jgi:hypothetical protein
MIGAMIVASASAAVTLTWGVPAAPEPPPTCNVSQQGYDNCVSYCNLVCTGKDIACVNSCMGNPY